jgi:hypothetical protein
MLRDTFVQFIACLAIALAIGVAASAVVTVGRCVGSLLAGPVLLACPSLKFRTPEIEGPAGRLRPPLVLLVP